MKQTDQLSAQLAEYLSHHGKATATEVYEATGYPESTVRKFLGILCVENLVHRTFGPSLMRGGRCIYYNAGPSPDGVAPDGGGFDSRATVKSWSPVKAVDPWMLPREFFQGVAL